MTFKPGDRVKVKDNYPVDNTAPTGADVDARGRTGEVIRYSAGLVYIIVKLDDSANRRTGEWFLPEELELL